MLLGFLFRKEVRLAALLVLYRVMFSVSNMRRQNGHNNAQCHKTIVAEREAMREVDMNEVDMNEVDMCRHAHTICPSTRNR